MAKTASKEKFSVQSTIGDTIILYRQCNPESSCEEILALIKKHFKGSATTIGSVASTLSKACKRLGDQRLFPGRTMRRDDDDIQIETFDINASTEEEDKETEEEARKRIMMRYEAMERLAPKVLSGKLSSLIVSGPPGLSKSWTVKAAVDASGRMRHDGMLDVGGGGPTMIEGMPCNGWYDWISGGCSEVGLYRALWNMRKGGVLVFDDCDGVYRDEDSINLLKIATDTTKERTTTGSTGRSTSRERSCSLPTSISRRRFRVTAR